jgi:hypothetical protein
MNMNPTNFWEWLPKLNDGDATAVVILLIIALVGIVAILSWMAYRIHKNRLEDALKRELLDRGMTAEEIATVINAGQSLPVPK